MLLFSQKLIIFEYVLNAPSTFSWNIVKVNKLELGGFMPQMSFRVNSISFYLFFTG